jgi:hypothetical protein
VLVGAGSLWLLNGLFRTLTVAFMENPWLSGGVICKGFVGWSLGFS